MTICATRRWLAAAILVWACAFEFLPIVSAPTEAAEVAVSAEVKDIRSKLESIRANLDQKEAALERRDLPDRDLQAFRQEVEPFATQIREMIAALAPKVDAARVRLEQLGPKKDDQPESEDAAKERTERQVAFAEYDETQRLAKALLVQSEQLSVQIGDRRRSLFTRALFQQSAGLAGPSLWSAVIDALPGSSTPLRSCWEIRSCGCSVTRLRALCSPWAWRSAWQLPSMPAVHLSGRGSSAATQPWRIPAGTDGSWLRSGCF